MEYTARIQRVRDQDLHRRQDWNQLSPSERLLALMNWRDEVLPQASIKRVTTVRRVSFG